MIRLVYSNRTESLLDAFARDVDAWRERVGPLEPAPLVVPNRNVETWLRFGLARRSGIAANLEVRFLRRLVASLAERSGLRLVDGEALQARVLSLLLEEERLAGGAFEPVRSYLAAAGDNADARDLRRFQLAARVARLFEEYEYSRPEMLQAWERGPVLGGTAFARTEAWQRPLWLAVHGPGGLLRREEAERWTRLGELLATGLRGVAVPPRLHVFGVSYVARAFQRLFASLARACELHVYTLNPCEEFWEDVEARGGRPVSGFARRNEHLEPSALDGEDPFGLAGADTPALRLWGRPGRENVRLLNELAGCDFEPAFGAPAGPDAPLLRRLQDDILRREPEPPVPAGLVPDGSIRLLACPGVRRECEIVAAEIWRLVQEDERRADGGPPLRFNDIAVIVTARERDAYFTHLCAALRDNHDIPHNVTDLDFSATSRVAGALERLLDLPFGGFTRREVLGLLTHPAVLARVPEADPDAWARWCEALGVVHGADRSDHAGTYIDGDALNWDQGLRRLALGQVLGADGDEPLLLGGEPYLPHEVAPSAGPEAARLTLLVRSLLADARFAREARLCMADWAVFLAGLVGSYLAPAGDQDERDLDRALGALRGLAASGLGDQRVSWRIARELAREALGGISAGRGHHLADGVVLSTSQPMRALPFRVIFLAGLGEGKFPAVDRHDRLDLREARRRAGDVSAREQDRYMFLETLLCARERLYLSWVSRDALTGEALEPSSLVVELRHVLERAYLGARVDELVVTHPLRRFDAGAFAPPLGVAPPGPSVHSAAAREEATARALRAHVRRPRPGLGPEPLKDRIAEEDRVLLARTLGLVPLPPRPREAPGAVVRLPLAALQRFLECPLQGWARDRLGLAGGDEEDLRDREDEPFGTSRLVAGRLLGELFLGRPGQGGWAAPYAERAAREAACGRLPMGVFSEAERDAHLRVLDQWDGLLRELGAAGVPRRVRFGPADEPGRGEEVRDAFALQVHTPEGPRTVQLVGRTAPLLESPPGALVAEYRRRATPDWAEKVRRRRRSLRAALDAALLTASGARAPGPHACAVLVADGERADAALHRVQPFAPDEARAWLRTLAADWLGTDHAYRLPCEAVLRRHVDGTPLAETIEQLFASERGLRPSSAYGPLPHPERYPVPADADELVARRFGPFFERLEVVR